MLKSRRILVGLILSGILLNACASTRYGKRKADNAKEISKGMTVVEVVEKIGEPQFITEDPGKVNWGYNLYLSGDDFTEYVKEIGYIVIFSEGKVVETKYVQAARNTASPNYAGALKNMSDFWNKPSNDQPAKQSQDCRTTPFTRLDGTVEYNTRCQ